MAANTYVLVDKMTSDKTEADTTFQKDAPAIMLKTACAIAAKVKGITTTPAKENGAIGFALEGKLTKLSKETKGKDDISSCVVTLSVLEWPKPFMVGRFHGQIDLSSGCLGKAG